MLRHDLHTCRLPLPMHNNFWCSAFAKKHLTYTSARSERAETDLGKGRQLKRWKSVAGDEARENNLSHDWMFFCDYCILWSLVINLLCYSSNSETLSTPHPLHYLPGRLKAAACLIRSSSLVFICQLVFSLEGRPYGGNVKKRATQPDTQLLHAEHTRKSLPHSHVF